ncbi:MAG: OB-fold nucleic acid binding domain-containing protein [Candidatus Pacebacteria bacterium]|nr:OB-fold nucleic acid binding domain-containing protein [Candidatus Paceibacterota bacterium]
MIEDIINERLKKRDNLVRAGYNVYPSHVNRQYLIGDILKHFTLWSLFKKNVSAGGRIMGMRNQGSIIFLDLKDESGNIQIVILKKQVSDFNLLKENLDIGDFIISEGTLFTTKAGEKSIKSKNILFATKSLRPLPSVWHGLKDVEERFRKRYLDLILNKEIKEKLVSRSNIISTIRQTLNCEGFLEVETPMLQPLSGGATARPFKTHHNALDMDLYLRIAPELYLKRLLVGGLEKVYEIGRSFRNEGMDRDHNPEFTTLELYWAYQDYNGLMEFVRKLLGQWIPGNWKTITFSELIKKTSDEIKKMKVEKLDALYKEERAKITEPIFVIDYPEVIMPLAKYKQNDPVLTESFQLIANGAELMKGFSEMNDPAAQREQMQRQEKEFRGGNEEASRLDEDFLEALEYGMPPAAGLGIGIDRLTAYITKSHALKEIIIFPTLKPKE